MPIKIRFNAQQVQLVPWPPRRGEGPSWLRDLSSLRAALRETVSDAEGAQRLREVLSDAGARGVHRMSDEALVEAAVGLLEDGQLMLIPPEWRWRPKLPASTSEPAQTGPASPAAPPPKPAKTFFALKIVDEKTGDPVSSVRMKITLPDGVEDYYTTGASGTIKIDDINPGTCDAACDLTGATMADTYEFKGEGRPPPPPDPSKVWPSRNIGASNLKRIAEIIRHKVTDKDSILSLATAHGLKWQALAKFNWGTDVPNEINQHLVDDNGIWKQCADGVNYMFTSTDHPGIMFIPKKWEKSGLATGTEHVFKVRHIVPFVVRLETLAGYRIPDAKYKIKWANKDTHEAKVGPQGIDMVEDPPPGPFTIEYLDHQEILAKGLAAEAREMMDERDQIRLLEILKYDKETTGNVVKFYDQYFNTHTGKGFVEDMYTQFTAQDDRDMLEFLLAINGQSVKSGAEAVEENPEAPIDIETDTEFDKVGALEPGGGSGGR